MVPGRAKGYPHGGRTRRGRSECHFARPRRKASPIRISSYLERRPIPPSMGRAFRILRDRRVRIAINAVFVSGALTAATLTALHFARNGWPLSKADPLLVVAAGVLFLAAYAFKAWGWQRLFAPGERPQALTLAAAGGAASVGGVALPGRFHEAIRIEVGRWLGEPCACRRSASEAWFLISVSWALRGLAVFVLLNALSVGSSMTLALAFLCASAASAALPIAPAGAATQAGAGAAILIVSGIPKTQALAFSVAAQAMVIVVGAAVVTVAGLWQLAVRFRPPRAVVAAR